MSEYLARGRVDELRIWGQVRTEAEIKAHWRSVVSLIEPAVYWRFDGGDSRTVEDALGSLDGLLVGGARWLPGTESAPLEYPYARAATVR